MQPTFTRKCTQCYHSKPDPEHSPEFAKRKVHAVASFDQRVFTSQDRFTYEHIRDSLLQLKQMSEEAKTIGAISCDVVSNKERLTWKDTVNRKRQFVKRKVQRQDMTSVAQISKFCKSSKELVKRVMSEVSRQGDVSCFEYNNLKSQEQVQDLDKTIDQIEEGFMTVTCIKRRQTVFSRKSILKALHQRGYRYRLLPKERKVPKKETANSTRICRII